MSNNGITIGCPVPSFTGLLAILFIGLKLTGVITWPWLWVLSPIWIPFVIVFICLLFIILCK